MVSVQEAIAKIQEKIQQMPVVELSLYNGLGKVLAENVVATINVPSFDNSAMDGYCFQWVDGCTEYEIIGQIQAGDTNIASLEPYQCARIYTGAMIPIGVDTVIQQELVSVTNNKISFNLDKIKKGANVRYEGSQSKIGDVVASAGTRITPSLIGLLASNGIENVKVFDEPKVSIIITGNELVKLGFPLEKGQIYNSNEFALKALLKVSGINDVRVFHAVDTLESVVECVQKASELADIVVLTGGISVGDFDFVKTAMENIGVEELFYKVKQKPGKPLFVAMKQSKWYFALPGNPAAVITCFNQYLKPTIEMFMGQKNAFSPIAKLPLAESYRKNGGLTHFLKGHYTFENVTLLKGQESFNLSSFNVANCIVELPEESEFIEKGTLVSVYQLPQ
jgi:molybdopterin molybdotransferase